MVGQFRLGLSIHLSAFDWIVLVLAFRTDPWTDVSFDDEGRRDGDAWGDIRRVVCFRWWWTWMVGAFLFLPLGDPPSWVRSSSWFEWGEGFDTQRKGGKDGGENHLVRTSTYTTTHVHTCLLPFGSTRGASHVSPRRSSRTRTRKIRHQRNNRNEQDERKGDICRIHHQPKPKKEKKRTRRCISAYRRVS